MGIRNGWVIRGRVAGEGRMEEGGLVGDVFVMSTWSSDGVLVIFQ